MNFNRFTPTSFDASSVATWNPIGKCQSDRVARTSVLHQALEHFGDHFAAKHKNEFHRCIDSRGRDFTGCNCASPLHACFKVSIGAFALTRAQSKDCINSTKSKRACQNEQRTRNPPPTVYLIGTGQSNEYSAHQNSK